jgi:hypothetical protein
MAHRLDGVRLKLVRAEQHLDAIAKAFKPYRYGTFQVRAKNDPQFGGRVFTIHLPHPGLTTSPVIGDCVHNIRSALDYIVSQFVLAAGGTPTHQGFPICDTLKSFKEHVRTKRLDGVPDKARAIIEGLQPYNGQRDCHLHPLWILSELANVDKHRFLTVTTVLATSVNLYAPTFGMLVLKGTELADGAEFCRDDKTDRVDVDAKGEMFVAFQDAPVSKRDVVVALQEILNFIRQTVVPGFEPFLD